MVSEMSQQSNMNPVVRAQLKDFKIKHSCHDLTDDEAFEIFTIYSTLNGGELETADPFLAHLKGSEFGIDGVAILIDGEITTTIDETVDRIKNQKHPNVKFLFFQSKSGQKFDYGDILKFLDSVSGFFDNTMKGESNQLDDLIFIKDYIYENAVFRTNPILKCFFITSGSYDAPTRIETLISARKNILSNLNIFDESEINISMIGAREIQRFYRTASASVEKEIDFDRNVALPTDESVEEGYIGYLPAKQLLKLCCAENDDGEFIGINKAVFFDNIRDFNPNSDINKEIIKDLQNGNGSGFVYRNNGVTVVARNIVRTGDRFRIEDYQIVNGCQTSNILFECLGHIDSVTVPFRVISSRNDEFISSVIVGNNKQNVVRDEQFWALRPLMKNLEEYCRTMESEHSLFLERRENQYRGQDNVERVRIIRPPEIMKSIAAMFFFQPNRASRDPRGIYKEFEEKIFQDNHDVRIYHAAMYAHYRLEFLWRNKRIDSDLKIYRYFILFTIGQWACDRADIFSMSRSKIDSSCKRILSLSEDEERLKNVTSRVNHAMNDVFSEMEIKSRERMRDTLRSETFVKQFLSKVKDLDL